MTVSRIRRMLSRLRPQSSPPPGASEGRGAAAAAPRPSGRRAAGLLAVLLVVAFGVGGIAQIRVETGVESFLPSSDPSVQRFEQLAESFGGDPIVVLLRSEKRSGLLDREVLPQVLGLEGTLSKLPDVASVYGPATTLNQLAGQSQKLLAELTGRRDGLRTFAVNQARAAGEGPAAQVAAGDRALAGFDERYGPLIVQGMPVGLPTLRNQRFIDNSIYNAAGQPRPQWRYVVPDERSLAVLVRPREGLSQGSTEDLVASVRDTVAAAGLPTSSVTVSGVPAITAALGASVDREVPVLGAIAVGAIGLCLFAVPWTRRRRRLIPLAVTLSATALTLSVLGWAGWPVSLGVVAFLPVLVGLGSYYPTYFARGAHPRTVLVVAAGTAAGFGTLALSPLPFVRDLGLTLAVGVALAVAIGWLVYRPGGVAGPDPVPSPVPTTPDATVHPRRRRVALAAGAALVALAGWATLPFLPLQTSVDELSSGLPAVAEADQVERVLGSGGELSVVIRAEAPGTTVLTPQAWEWMTAAQETIVRGHGDEARPALSAPSLLSFLGPTPTPEQIQAGVRLLPPYLTGAVLRSDGAMSVLSFGVRLDDLDRLRTLTTAITAELPPAPPGYRVELSGLPAVAVQGYDLVSADRYLAGTAGLLAAGVVLIAGLSRRTASPSRGARRGDATRAVCAAALATGAELFLLWLTGTPLNPLTVALGSLTAAVGCEFTIMTCDAVRGRDPRLRTAVALAALTSGAGFAVLAFSQLAVIREFGLLLALSVVLSYAAARFVVLVAPPAPSVDDPPDERTAGESSLVGVM